MTNSACDTESCWQRPGRGSLEKGRADPRAPAASLWLMAASCAYLHRRNHSPPSPTALRGRLSTAPGPTPHRCRHLRAAVPLSPPGAAPGPLRPGRPFPAAPAAMLLPERPLLAQPAWRRPRGRQRAAVGSGPGPGPAACGAHGCGRGAWAGGAGGRGRARGRRRRPAWSYKRDGKRPQRAEGTQGL